MLPDEASFSELMIRVDVIVLSEAMIKSGLFPTISTVATLLYGLPIVKEERATLAH